MGPSRHALEIFPGQSTLSARRTSVSVSQDRAGSYVWRYSCALVCLAEVRLVNAGLVSSIEYQVIPGMGYSE